MDAKNEQSKNSAVSSPHGTSRTFDVWLGVRLTVEATNAEKAEQTAGEWLQNAVRNGHPDSGVTVNDPPINLVDTAVRLLNEQGEQARREERERKAARALENGN